MKTNQVTIQEIEYATSKKRLVKQRGGPKRKATDIVTLMNKWDYSLVDKINVMDALASFEVFEVVYLIYSLENLASSRLDDSLYKQYITDYLQVVVDFPDYIGNLLDSGFPLPNIPDEPFELVVLTVKLHSLFCCLPKRNGKAIAEVMLSDEPLSIGLLEYIKDLPNKDISENLYLAIEKDLHSSR